MLNYRHSEPYCLLKNAKDLVREEHHHPTRWAKQTFKGMLIGSLLGFAHFVGGNTGQFEMNKLVASIGMRDYSGRVFRMFRGVLGPYAFGAGGAFLLYTLIHDELVHHDEANNRPRFLDHAFALTVVGTLGGIYFLNHPFHIFCSGLFSLTIAAPTSWFMV